MVAERSRSMVKIDWYTRLRKLRKRPSCVPVWLCHGNKRIQGYLHAIPYPKKKPHKRGAKPDNAPKTKDVTPARKPLPELNGYRFSRHGQLEVLYYHRICTLSCPLAGRTMINAQKAC